MLEKLLHNIVNSNHSFSDDERVLKNRIQMLNISVVLSVIAFIYGIFINSLVNYNLTILIVEITAMCIVVPLTYMIRVDKKYYIPISNILVAIYTLAYLALIAYSNPIDLKHVWLFTYPTILFFFKDAKVSIRWLLTLIFFMNLIPFIDYFPSGYSQFQTFYISFVIMIISLIIYFYHIKLDEDNRLIFQQKQELEILKNTLENRVEEKTKELLELNAILENRVDEKVGEILKKDAMLVAQSRNATMGEMINMIAHQWRQPLQTMTLQISNNKFNVMLDKSGLDESIKTLDTISDTLIYLSDTIDDFRNFFKPDKEKNNISIAMLIERAINFSKPKLDTQHISLSFTCNENIFIDTYVNELIQVLINIINNASDAIAESNSPIKQIVVEVEQSASEVIINFEDSGGGIEEDALNHLFEPYFSTKEKNGTGLGLYMSKMIIESQLKGHIEAVNINQGARFSIFLPLDEKNDG